MDNVVVESDRKEIEFTLSESAYFASKYLLYIVPKYLYYKSFFFSYKAKIRKNLITKIQYVVFCMKTRFYWVFSESDPSSKSIDP